MRVSPAFLTRIRPRVSVVAEVRGFFHQFGIETFILLARSRAIHSASYSLLIRTSLELKPLSSWLVVAQFIAPLTLLIEPVWN